MFSHYLLRRLLVLRSLCLGNFKLPFRCLLASALWLWTFLSPTRTPSNTRSFPDHWRLANIHRNLLLDASCSGFTPAELEKEDFRKEPRHIFLSIGAGIAQSQRQSKRLRNKSCSHDKSNTFFSSHSVQSDSETHSGSYLFPRGVRRLRHEANYSPASSPEVKNGGAIPPLPPYLHGVVFN
jgi:hypothetical protein